MEFSVKTGNPDKVRSACVVVGVYEPRRLSPAAAQLDQASGGHISRLLRRGDLEGKTGQTLLLHDLPNTAAERVLLVGCGKEREIDDKQYRDITAAAVKRLNDTGATECASFLGEVHVKGRDLHWRIRQTVEATQSVLYRFDQLKSKKEPPRHPLRKLTCMVTDGAEVKTAEAAVREGLAIAKAVQLTKDLGNLPGNICTPIYLGEQAKALGKSHKAIKVKVLDVPAIEKLGMGSFLSVAKGSVQPPRFIILEYKGGKPKTRPIVLVGKGLTFDSGGISIKPAAAMDEMKYDMCGGASVLGAFLAVAELKLPLNLVGLIPATENLPDGNANKPGDVVTSMSGQTIEILNTDAEGRLILCDALTYAERYEPAAVIDIATLTGACVIALGSHASGLLGNHPPLVHELLNAGKESGDRAWEMPLWDEYQDQLKSNFADMANIGGREGGTITAACFLARYTKKYHWAHLDIAGTAWKSGGDKGATGRPVPLLIQYLLNASK